MSRPIVRPEWFDQHWSQWPEAAREFCRLVYLGLRRAQERHAARIPQVARQPVQLLGHHTVHPTIGHGLARPAQRRSVHIAAAVAVIVKTSSGLARQPWLCTYRRQRSCCTSRLVPSVCSSVDQRIYTVTASGRISRVRGSGTPPGCVLTLADPYVGRGQKGTYLHRRV